MITRFCVRVIRIPGGTTRFPLQTSTGVQVDLSALRTAIDESWVPLDELAILDEEDRFVCRYIYRTNTETIENDDSWDLMSRSLQKEWRRIVREIRCYIATVRALQLLRRIETETAAGGVWTEEDLRNAGLVPHMTTTRPGYYPRTGYSFANSLQFYKGVYGAGLVERIPRYDTVNYHYIKYWLYELTEVMPL